MFSLGSRGDVVVASSPGAAGGTVVIPGVGRPAASAALLAWVILPLCAAPLFPAQPPDGGTSVPSAASGRKKSADALLDVARSKDLFFRERAEGELRQRGVEALPVLAKALADPDASLRLRLWPIFRDLVKVALDDLDSDAALLFRDRLEEAALLGFKSGRPKEIEKLRREIQEAKPPQNDPEKQRSVESEVSEKKQKLAMAEESLRDAEARLPEIQARLPERVQRVEEGRKTVLGIGLAAFGPLAARREGLTEELKLHNAGLLETIRRGIPDDQVLPPLPPARGPAPAGDLFERSRYLLSTLWAFEIDSKGPLAEKVRPLLERHLAQTVEDLKNGDHLARERAEEDLFVLNRRGTETLASHAAEIPPGQFERLQGLYSWRIDPRLHRETGMDFRDYDKLPFRARRRLVIRYARAAGRAAIPTLRLVALDEKREPSLRVRLVAAEALAGPNIRDRSAILLFEQLYKPELVKIPRIAREFVLINGIGFLEEKSYDKAVTEFKKILDESPYDFQANYRIAFTYLLMKNYARSIFHFEVARRVQPRDELTLYNLSCAYSLDGQLEKALDTLEESIKAGFADYRHMEGDPDLKALRTQPRFHEIVDGLKKSAAGEDEGAGKKGGEPDEN
jgi:tetratricopeptide (TPR) repeat protein